MKRNASSSPEYMDSEVYWTMPVDDAEVPTSHRGEEQELGDGPPLCRTRAMQAVHVLQIPPGVP